ncbi:MAG: hypothetical protein H7Z41_14795 [Cytophagales bacterium]|nr:hypothetical protein [Armatimonadota bacterium]
MRTIKTATVVIATIASGITLLNILGVANAGPGAGPKDGKMGGRRMGGGRMYQQLNLTDAQKTQMKTIQTDAMKQRQTITGNKALTEDQKKDQMKSLMKSTMGKIEGILTADQKKQLEKAKTERRSKMQSARAAK